jgi:PAS domain S-box-containing protein
LQIEPGKFAALAIAPPIGTPWKPLVHIIGQLKGRHAENLSLLRVARLEADESPMSRGLSIFKQVLILVTLPLIVQLCSLIWLAHLQNEAEKDLEQAARAKNTAELITKLTADLYTVAATYGAGKAAPLPTLPMTNYLEQVIKLRNDIKAVKVLAIGDAPLMEATKDTEKKMAKCLSDLLALRSIYSSEKDPLQMSEAGKPYWRDLRVDLLAVLSSGLINIGHEKKELAMHSTETQAALRKESQLIMLGVGVLNLALTILAGLFIARRITNRINQVSDNAYRVASDLPLNKQLSGQDEIANLDRLFHKMAAALKEAARKERALVDNAQDLIGSLDESGKVIAINPASTKLLGITPEEINGKYFIDTLRKDDVSPTLGYLAALKKQPNDKPLTLRIKKRDASILDAVMSAYWSATDKTTFFVIHDMTAYKQAERMKQEVTAMITHDLRTPLTTVNHICEFLENGKHGQLDEKGNEYLTSARRNLNRMLALVNDLLDIEKIQSGMMTADLSNVSIEECFAAAEQTLGSLAEQSGVKLVFKTTDAIAVADEEKLDRVLFNLVSNAIKFSPRNSIIAISADIQEAFVQIDVSDQGTGVAEDQLELIFERFQKGSSSSDSNKEGSGLGLAICKALVQLQGGRIWAASKPGSGSTFSFTLPLARRD